MQKKQQPDLRRPRTGMRKSPSAAALRAHAPGGRGLRHDKDSKGRYRSVFLKASQLLTCYFLPATGTIRERAKETL